MELVEDGRQCMDHKLLCMMVSEIVVTWIFLLGRDVCVYIMLYGIKVTFFHICLNLLQT